MNNNCITIKSHNKSFQNDINPLIWLKQWNYHATLYLRALLAGVRNPRQFFSVRDKFVSGIASRGKLIAKN